MTDHQFQIILDSFHTYADRFIRESDDNLPYILKKEHTLAVVANIDILCTELALNAQETFLARTSALLHDFGRFRQYETWNTFSDGASTDHASLGVAEIEAHQILDRLNALEKADITASVAVHNKFSVPEKMTPRAKLLSRLVRDADKIDIYRVMAEKYLQDRSLRKEENQFITLGLEESQEISDHLVQQLFEHKLLDKNEVKTLNDLKLLQVSWLFDLNFCQSICLVRKRGHLERIFNTLPQTPRIRELEAFIQSFVSRVVC